MKSCAHCQKPIRGRSDKRFCDDACRANHNNEQRAREPAETRRINQLLRRNRNILAQLLSNRMACQLPEDDLAELGFCFKYVTHIASNNLSNIQFGCYEFYWKRLSQRRIEIRRKNNSNEKEYTLAAKTSPVAGKSEA